MTSMTSRNPAEKFIVMNNSHFVLFYSPALPRQLPALKNYLPALPRQSPAFFGIRSSRAFGDFHSIEGKIR